MRILTDGRLTHIVTLPQPVVVSPAQEGRVELSHVVTAVVVLVRVVQACSAAGAGEFPHQGQLQPLLNLTGGAACTGGGADRDGGDGGGAGARLAPVVSITHGRLVRAVLVVTAAWTVLSTVCLPWQTFLPSTHCPILQ